MWLTVKEASELYRIKRSTLYLWVESGTVPHYKLGRLVRFKKDDLDKWLEKFRKEAGSDSGKSRKYPARSRGYDISEVVRKAIDEVKGHKV